MTEGFRLSEKVLVGRFEGDTMVVFTEEDVKEFIRFIRERAEAKSSDYKSAVDNEWDACISIDNLNEILDDLAGKELIK